MAEEPLPINENIKVEDYTTIYKTSKWWCVVALCNAFGHMQIRRYLWIKDSKTGKWKRKNHWTTNFPKNWEDEKVAVEKYLPRLERVQTA